jgi:hypothetical protein
MPFKWKTSVACEYAKCKNRLLDFTIVMPVVCSGVNILVPSSVLF